MYRATAVPTAMVSADQRVEAAVDQREADLAAHVPLEPRTNALVLALLLPEGLHHSQRRERFLHAAHRGALDLLDLRPLVANPSAEHLREAEQHRRHEHRDHRELPVDARRDVRHPERR